jgi:phage shock protein A
MFKTLFTLVRGAAAAAEGGVIDRSALLILDQQIRDAATAVERGKRALAVAVAHDEAEGKRLEATLARLADLEERAVAALAGGREDLALEAAESIAMMEADRDAVREARSTFASEIAHLKKATADAGRRLAELERGRRIAQAAEAVRRLKARGPVYGGGVAALSDAEATLRRLRERPSRGRRDRRIAGFVGCQRRRRYRRDPPRSGGLWKTYPFDRGRCTRPPAQTGGGQPCVRRLMTPIPGNRRLP